MVDTTTEPTEEPTDGELAQLPPERLATMLRDKRKAEADARSRLRAAETERDALKGTVTGFQRVALNEAASGAGVAKTALADLDTHLPLESVLGEDGLLDPDKTAAAIQSLRAERPHMFGAGSPASGAAGYSGADGAPAPTASWGDVLRG